MGPGSIAQLLQHSDVLRGRYARYLRDLQNNPIWNSKLGDFSAAKHRFDSWQRPLARICFTFDAVVMTAQAMHEERRSEAVGRHCKAFLQRLDEEAMLSLAMMSDAGEENLSLIRFLDSERVDTMELASECVRFLARIGVLFEQRGCLKTGFTGLMIDMLRTPRLVFIDHTPKTIGGKRAQELAPTIDRCLNRLQQWVILANHVLRAEMPKFESIQSFSALRLTPLSERRQTTDDERATLNEKLAKLAQLLRCDTGTLTDQFFDHLPVAQNHYDHTGCTSFAGWRHAIETVRGNNRRHRANRAHPCDQLLRVLIRAGAWGASTSGVEQLFSTSRAAHVCQRASLEDMHIRDELFLLSTKSGATNASDQELAEGAALVWSKVYGACRAPAAAPRRSGAASTRSLEGTQKATLTKLSAHLLVIIL